MPPFVLNMKKKLELPDFKVVTDIPVATQIYTYLRELISNGTLEPGRRLSENELSDFFSVSRQPVREAIMRLRLDGLLFVQPQRGTLVQKISVQNLKQSWFIRKSLECASLENLVNLSDETLKEFIAAFDNNLQEQREAILADDKKQFLILDEEFHKLICALSTYDMTYNFLSSIKGHMDRIRYLSMVRISPMKHLYNDHALIVEAIKNKDTLKAKNLLSEHLSEILSTYKVIKKENQDWFTDEDIR